MSDEEPEQKEIPVVKYKATKLVVEPKTQTRQIKKFRDGEVYEILEYDIEYVPLNGDDYEKMMVGTPTDKSGQSAKAYLLRQLRKKMLLTVAGEKYDDLVTRTWEAWKIIDVNDFLWDYLQGNF